RFFTDMTFDVDETIKVLREFAGFMRKQVEPKWADILDNCGSELVAADDNYQQAVEAFRKSMNRIWAGVMTGGLFEEPDSDKWKKGPADAREELLIYRNRLHDLWTAAKKEIGE